MKYSSYKNYQTIFENFRKFVNEEQFDARDPSQWNNAIDNDYPAQDQADKSLKSNRVIVFDKSASYKLTPDMTHGLDSHAAKHASEFAAGPGANDNIQLKQHLSAARELIKQRLGEGGGGFYIYAIEKGGEQKPQKIKFEDITLGDLINTFDFLNDKNVLRGEEALSQAEHEIYNIFSEISDAYAGEANRIYNNAADVSDKEYPRIAPLAKFLKTNPIIKFKAIYDGEEREYVVDTGNTAMLSTYFGDSDESGSESLFVATIFKREKGKENITLRDKLKDFGTGKNTALTDEYSVLRKMADRLNEISANRQKAEEDEIKARKARKAEEAARKAAEARKFDKEKVKKQITKQANGMRRGGKSDDEIRAAVHNKNKGQFPDDYENEKGWFDEVLNSLLGSE
jgi:hypothetical protein